MTFVNSCLGQSHKPYIDCIWAQGLSSKEQEEEEVQGVGGGAGVIAESGRLRSLVDSSQYSTQLIMRGLSGEAMSSASRKLRWDR